MSFGIHKSNTGTIWTSLTLASSNLLNTFWYVDRSSLSVMFMSRDLYFGHVSGRLMCRRLM